MAIYVGDNTTIKAKCGGRLYCLHITRDDFIESPREWDGNPTTMACFHSRYSLGDSGLAKEPDKFWQALVSDHISNDELIEAIHTVYGGSDYISKEMVPYLVEGFVNRHEEKGDGYLSLRERELEVLTLIARGYGNKEIGEKLFISVKTVESYRAKIMNKLGLKTRAELVEYALKKKLL